MKVLFLTNMPAYHQIQLAEQLNNLLGENNFRLSVFAPLNDERKQMRWHDSYQSTYLLRFSEREEDRVTTQEWIKSADIVIHGRFPIRYVKPRIKAGKLTFAYQERFWKKPKSVKRIISRAAHLYRNYYSVNKPNYHLLAAGSFAAKDLNSMGLFKNRSWRFGYFIDSLPPTKKPSGKLKLIWCGRMIALKQPEAALDIAKALTDARIEHELTMVGGGELLASIKQQSHASGLTQVKFTDWLSVNEVNQELAQANVLLMTSNHREGWGMVVNEAINNSCFVVANRSIGSANWLVKHGQTGLLYDGSSFTEMLTALTEYCRDPEIINQMASAAHSELTDHWSSRAAAKRLIRLSNTLLNDGSPDGSPNGSAYNLYEQGPCSPVRD